MLEAADAAAGPGGRMGLAAEAGPLIGLRVSLSRNLWRIGPAWAVLAGALAGGAPLWGGAALLRLAGAVGLADSAWGAVWWLTAAVGAESLREHRPIGSLPYAQPDAPVARLAGGLRRMVSSGASWHELTAGLASMAVLSVLLGGPALILSPVALLVILCGWVLAQRGLRPGLCYALLNVGLPWVLGTMLARQGALSALTGRQLHSLWLAAAFTILQWGVQRAYLSELSWARGVWLGQAALTAVLIGLRQPGPLAVVVGLLLPPSWWLLKTRQAACQADADGAEALVRSAPWWWGAMLLAAIALA
ncbi:MAG: hypothetical protein CVU38_16500 [Chloroflexi bacterium HGW-Chloroflexi-1]|nr:MAG: hypothetical protein CVU38_16500 [Chloroflexi bacterium HGW-Chloroflexi-1]